jgi:peptide deformylase
LAAVQVGVLKRVLVMDIDYKTEGCDDHGCGHVHNISNQNPRFLVNPKIITASKEKSEYFEGCLSFPEIRADIIRPKTVTVEYLDYDGNKQTLEASGILATCVQHEIDHLNGVTFVDYLSKLKQEMILKKMKKRHK